MVNYTVGGPATPDADYTALTGSVTFAPFAPTADVTVTALDDSLGDPDEAVVVDLASGTGYTIGGPPSALMLIIDNEAVVTVAKIADGVEGVSDGTFRFSRTGDPSGALTVYYWVGGTASPDVDYTNLSGEITFAPSSATADLTVDVLDDSTAEFDESVIVYLDNGTVYAIGSASEAMVTIADNETPVVKVEKIDNALEGSWPGVFGFARLGDKSQQLTISFAVSGTATSGSDYTPIGNEATFTAGEATAYRVVSALSDSIYDPDETVTLTLQSETGYQLAPDYSATVTIEGATPAVFVEKIVDASEDGGEGKFRFARTGDLSQSLTVNYAASGTATSGTDYMPLSGSVTFAAGSAEVDVLVIPIDDVAADAGEVVTVTIQTSTGYLVGTLDSATTMIVDNETPVVTVEKITDATEGGSSGTFRFTRTGNTVASLTVNYTVSGSATPGTDYTLLSGSVTFAAGSDTALVDVVPIDNAVVEGTMTVVVTVTSGSIYGAVPNGTALVNIIDDDWLNQNEAPVVHSPATQDLGAGTSITLSSGTGNGVSITDADAGSSSLQVSLSTGEGTVTLASMIGLTFVAGANGSSSLTFMAPLTSINTSLENLQFSATSGYQGVAEIAITANDLGNTGVGGPQVGLGIVRLVIGDAIPNDLPVVNTSNLFADPMPPLATPTGVTIGTAKVTTSDADYQKYVKYLTVDPDVQAANAATFNGNNIAQIKAIENPIRRQIFTAMSGSSDHFPFKTRQEAELAFYMRIEAIQFMKKIQLKQVDFAYYALPATPASAPADFWVKQPNQNKDFVFDTVSGKTAHDALAAIAGGKFRGECLGAIHLTVLIAADKAYAKFGTTAAFNALFPQGIKGVGSSRLLPTKPVLDRVIMTQVEVKNNEAARKEGLYYKETITVADMIPGDAVYLQNKEDYAKDLKPNVKPGYWSGENAIYLGTYKKAGDTEAKPYFSGMGLYEVSEEDFKKELKKQYDAFKVEANTTKPGMAQLADIKWTRVFRLGSGMKPAP